MKIPDNGKSDNYIFFFSGLIILIALDFNDIPVRMKDDRVKENGNIRIIHIPPGETMKFIKNLYLG